MHITIQNMIVSFFCTILCFLNYIHFLVLYHFTPFFFYLWFCCARPPIFPLLLFSLFVIYSYILRTPVIYCQIFIFLNQIFEDMLDFIFSVLALILINVNCKRLFMWIVHVYWSVNCNSYEAKHGSYDRMGSAKLIMKTRRKHE